MRKLKPDEILARRHEGNGPLAHPLATILEDVRSLYNVGSIFRTADAAGFREVLLAGITGTPENRGLRKTALGAELTMPWRHFASAASAIEAAEADGYRVAVLEITDGPRALETLSLDDFPLCLVVGNEVRGVSQHAVALADFAIEVPQFGHKHSINAAVAFGIAAFDLVRLYRRLCEEAPPSTRFRGIHEV
jgi:tRNA G18 (ribose-2'-O)-methylase SpoU